ncbi:P-loop containing nucleoside triphosphate hydrolase protein [Lenzites betulinus]|nr:P-loop containing nucleoside triphosphate hydrolase protein [Lenzites betulinus]
MDAISVLQTVMSAIQSGSMNLTVPDASAAGNTTHPTAAASVASFSPLQIPSLISMLLSFSAVRDWLKLLLLGAVVETCRRLMTRSYYGIINYFWITATFDGNDECVDWLMFWLSKHSIFRTARTLDVSTRTFGRRTTTLDSDNEDDTEGRKISFLPSLLTTYTLWYRFRYVTITRDQVTDGPWNSPRQTLQVRILTRDHNVLRELLVEAKKLYHQASENLISIYVSDPSSDYWKRVSTQHKRPMKSIILDPGVIELVMNDAKDFLASKAWYAERGIPHRRGYLLYGAPGSGKTSLIHSVAGELDLDVYILSLARLGLDDTSLSSTIADLPEQCIVLVEDIDAAFHQGVKRDLADPEKEADSGKDAPPHGSKGSSEPAAPSVGRVTLSGLLNALDGIAAQEGRILFATTNDYEALDPALCRPGRLDLHIEFRLASKYQCREMFRRFYLPSDVDDKIATTDGEDTEQAVDEKDSGYGSRRGSVEGLPPAPTPAPSPPLPQDASPKPTPTPSDSEDSSAVYVGQAHTARAPKLSRKKAAELADRFAAAIPNRAFSMATLQGYLMAYKTRPYDAVEEAPAWVARRALEKKGKPAARAESPAAPQAKEEGEVLHRQTADVAVGTSSSSDVAVQTEATGGK